MSVRTGAFVLVSLIAGLAACGGSPRPAAVNDGRPIALAVRPPAAPAARSWAPWPQFGHDATHSGSAPVVGPQHGAVRWRRRLEGAVVPGPAVGLGGVVYAASNAGVLHAIDLRTGRDRWRFDGGGAYGSDLSTVAAVLRDGTVLWPGPRDTVFALSRKGRVLWRERLAGQPLSPAVAPGGTIVLADQAGTVEALRGRRRLWRVRLGGTSYSSPAIASDGTVYAASDQTLAALRAGRVSWRARLGDTIEVSPAVGPDGTVVIGANDGIEYGFAPDGRQRWRHRIGALTYSSPAAARDGLVWFGDHHGFVNVLRNGDLVGRFLGRGRSATLRSVGVWTQPVLDAQRDVYFGTRPGHVYGFTAAGRRLFDLYLGATVDSYPALAADGTLVVGSESGQLVAIG